MDRTLIKTYYDEDNLVNLIKDLLSGGEVWVKETSEARIEVHMNAYGPNVRSKIRDWLLVKERLIGDYMQRTDKEAEE